MLGSEAKGKGKSCDDGWWWPARERLQGLVVALTVSWPTAFQTRELPLGGAFAQSEPGKSGRRRLQRTPSEETREELGKREYF